MTVVNMNCVQAREIENHQHRDCRAMLTGLMTTSVTKSTIITVSHESKLSMMWGKQ